MQTLVWLWRVHWTVLVSPKGDGRRKFSAYIGSYFGSPVSSHFSSVYLAIQWRHISTYNMIWLSVEWAYQKILLLLPSSEGLWSFAEKSQPHISCDTRVTHSNFQRMSSSEKFSFHVNCMIQFLLIVVSQSSYHTHDLLCFFLLKKRWEISVNKSRNRSWWEPNESNEAQKSLLNPSKEFFLMRIASFFRRSVPFTS